MDGLATASPHIGATATQVQQLGLTTFTYTTGGAGDIQGLADRGGSGGVPRQHQNLHAAAHGVQIQGLQPAQRPTGHGMVIAQPPTAQLPPMSTSRQGKPDDTRIFLLLAQYVRVYSVIKIVDTPWLWLVSLGMRVNVGVEQQGSEKHVTEG